MIVVYIVIIIAHIFGQRYPNMLIYRHYNKNNYNGVRLLLSRIPDRCRTQDVQKDSDDIPYPAAEDGDKFYTVPVQICNNGDTVYE